MKILLNYMYDLYPFTTASYIQKAIERRSDLELILRDDLATKKPDIIINIEPVPYFVKIKGVPTGYWEIDNHVILGNDRHFYNEADIVFLAQRYFEGFYSDYKTAWVPLAADPTIHKRYDQEPIKYDIGLVGNDTYPERRQLLEKLKQRFNVFVGQTEPGEPYARQLSQFSMVFNKSMNKDINMRVFEALSCGRFLLTDMVPDQNVLITDKIDYISYDDEIDLLDKVWYYLNHEQEREQIARAGQKQCLLNHTYDKRLCEMIHHLQSLKSVS